MFEPFQSQKSKEPVQYPSGLNTGIFTIILLSPWNMIFYYVLDGNFVLFADDASIFESHRNLLILPG